MYMLLCILASLSISLASPLAPLPLAKTRILNELQTELSNRHVYNLDINAYYCPHQNVAHEEHFGI